MRRDVRLFALGVIALVIGSLSIAAAGWVLASLQFGFELNYQQTIALTALTAVVLVTAFAVLFRFGPVTISTGEDSGPGDGGDGATASVDTSSTGEPGTNDSLVPNDGDPLPPDDGPRDPVSSETDPVAGVYDEDSEEQNVGNTTAADDSSRQSSTESRETTAPRTESDTAAGGSMQQSNDDPANPSVDSSTEMDADGEHRTDSADDEDGSPESERHDDAENDETRPESTPDVDLSTGLTDHDVDHYGDEFPD